MISKPELIEQVKLEGFATASVGMYTLGDIREELRKPGRDPREKFAAAKFATTCRRSPTSSLA